MNSVRGGKERNYVIGVLDSRRVQTFDAALQHKLTSPRAISAAVVFNQKLPAGESSV